ncbi:unnamed protein product [Clonostachys chloroleuca]|uniref:BTB domain-containing protein n=1 Tax=Clonostachys chloroleuca TaxID=1926264 RepID=A0AA35M156_9HYPO|nr:unnamed protein product [Clonostachys chloroleuca]
MALVLLPSSLVAKSPSPPPTEITHMHKNPSPRSSSPVDLDYHGDVKLRVGEKKVVDGQSIEPIYFTACSRTLARISPVFDRMLYGHFAEARKPATPDEDWIVNLPNDKPEPMGILLGIAHCQFRSVPKTLALDQLYDLTVLTNYYDATALLSPWVDSWIACMDGISKHDARVLLPKVLWIAWELGKVSILEDTARRMLLEVDGPPFMDTCEEEDIQSPPDVVERIDAIRTQTTRSLLEVVGDMTEALVVVDERPRWCRHAQWMGHHKCESMILGSMTFCLARAGLWPLPEAEEVEYSTLSLYGKLTELVIHDIGEERLHDVVRSHAECNPRRHVLRRLRSIMEELPSSLTEKHMATVEKQRQRLMAS